MDFSGCLVVVSHDRYFMDKLVDHVWVVGEDGATSIRDYPGNYSQYRAARAESQKRAQAEKAAIAAAAKSARRPCRGAWRLFPAAQLQREAGV